jgi:hypothetical protein
VILVASAELGPARSAAAQIRDNSFLVEEAYNQDRDVVQHIGVFTSSRDGRWVFNATDEWPMGGLRDQVSAGLTLFDEGLGVEYGALALNYRRQMIGHPDASAVFSPRVTLIAELGAGAGTGLAMQANLPLTVVLSGAFVSHWNLGATIGLGPALGNAGGSVVWLATPWMNFLVEGLYLGAAGAAPGYVVSPGVRWAANLGSVQVVPGVAFPISLTDAEEDLVLFYLSIEHPFGSAVPD